jgi:hypothetical protein
VGFNRKLSKDEFSGYVNRVGPAKAKEQFSILGKLDTFVSAAETDIGRELLKDIREMEVALNVDQIMKSYKTPQEKEEDRLLLKAFVMIGLRWSDRINKYEKALNDMRQKGQ